MEVSGGGTGAGVSGELNSSLAVRLTAVVMMMVVPVIVAVIGRVLVETGMMTTLVVITLRVVSLLAMTPRLHVLPAALLSGADRVQDVGKRLSTFPQSPPSHLLQFW